MIISLLVVFPAYHIYNVETQQGVFRTGESAAHGDDDLRGQNLPTDEPQRL